MDGNYELAGVLAVIVAGLLYGLVDYWLNGGRERHPDEVESVWNELMEKKQSVNLIEENERPNSDRRRHHHNGGTNRA